MDFRTFVRTIAFRWKIVVAATLACLLGAAAFTALQAKTYEASATVLMSLSGTSTINEYWEATQASQQRVLSYTEIAHSRAVAQRAIDQLGVPMTADQLVSHTTVTYTPGSLMFRLTVADSDPKLAASLAGEIVDQFATMVPQLQPQPAPYTYAAVTERPTVPDTPVSPVPMRNLALGLLAGVLLGIALALIRDATDRTVRTSATLSSVAGVPVLAKLPRYHVQGNRGQTTQRSNAQLREAVRNLRTRLLALAGTQPRSLLIASSGSDDGASRTAFDLGLAFTEIREKVVLVEGDSRQPVIAGSVGIESEAGLADVLTERQPLDSAVHETPHTDLWVLASEAAADPDHRFGSAVLARTVEKLCARFDRVVIDGPPVLATAETAILAGAADATVLVVRAGKTTVDEVTSAVESLRAAGGNLVGAVLTDTALSRHEKAAAQAYRAKVSEAM